MMCGYFINDDSDNTDNQSNLDDTEEKLYLPEEGYFDITYKI